MLENELWIKSGTKQLLSEIKQIIRNEAKYTTSKDNDCATECMYSSSLCNGR